MDGREDKSGNGKTDEKEIDLKEEGLKFEKDYDDFLLKLKNMPKDSKEAKEARWEFFRSYSGREEFMIKVWEASHPNAYKKLRNQLNASYDSSFRQDAGMASVKNKKNVDPVLFQEAIREAIETYTGRSQKGEEHVFIACVGQLYRQRAGEEANKRAFEEHDGITRSRWKRRELCRFIKAVNKTYEALYPRSTKSVQSLKDTIEYILAGSGGYSITPKDRDFVIKYIMGKNSVLSLEEEIKGAENITLGDVIADEAGEENDYEEAINRMVPFLKDLEDNWEDLKAFENLKTQIICKMFLTKGVLMVMKTDENKQPYREEPAGNEAAYQFFRPWGNFLYERVFYEKYMQRAFMKKPEDFIETYVKILREDFNFSDEFLAKVEGKDKATISRYRKEFVRCMKFFY